MFAGGTSSFTTRARVFAILSFPATTDVPSLHYQGSIRPKRHNNITAARLGQDISEP